MLWNPAIESMPRGQLEALQGQRLAELARYVHARQAPYRHKMDAAGVSASDIGGLADLRKLPFTTKSDLRDAYPFGLLCVPMSEVVRVHASSGTTGKPTVVGYTRDDLAMWAEVCARCFGLSGARPGDMFQNAYGYGLFTGGLGMHDGGELFGCTVVPVSGGNTARQIMLLQDFKTAVMACTPSYALTLADELLARGVDPNSLSVRAFILGAEPWTEQMRADIERKLGAHAVNIYGLSEVIGPGVSNECVEAKDGMHIAEDHFLAEVIAPDTGEPVPDGEVGEIVFTTLTKQAMPLIRYRTGDLCSITRAPCKCGRTHARMSRIVGRTDDMLIIRGVNVFPSQVEAALVDKPPLTPHYQLVVTREAHLDSIEVRIEADDEFFRSVGEAIFAQHLIAPQSALRAVEARAQRVLRDALGLNAKVVLLAPGTAPRSEGGKLKRVLDLRK